MQRESLAMVWESRETMGGGVGGDLADMGTKKAGQVRSGRRIQIFT